MRTEPIVFFILSDKMEYKYKLSLISMFKNEQMILEEWIQHYISEGVQHFYLIDNGSTDSYIQILNKYIDKITLIIDSSRDERETQNVLFNKHYLDLVKKESEWVIICDADEYIYNRNKASTLLEYVNTIPDTVDHILLPWKNFGNNALEKQPSSIVSSFTKHEEPTSFRDRILYANWRGHCKSLTRTANILQLENHSPHTTATAAHFSDFTIADISQYNVHTQTLHINHYQTMSYEYYTTVKMNRGDAQGSTNWYSIHRFTQENSIYNSVDDLELASKKACTPSL